MANQIKPYTLFLTMNKRDYEELEAREEPTVDTENEEDVDMETTDKGKEKEDTVERNLPPKKRARTEVTPFGMTQEDWSALSTEGKRSVMRQCFDSLNARCDVLEYLAYKDNNRFL